MEAQAVPVAQDMVGADQRQRKCGVWLEHLSHWPSKLTDQLSKETEDSGVMFLTAKERKGKGYKEV